MISKLKRNTISIYCVASMIMLCAMASNVTDVTTQLKTNSKKVVANNNYVETEEVSYGLVALEASSCIEKNEDANVTEKKENEASNKTTENKTSSTAKKTTTKKKTTKKTAKKTNTTKLPSNIALGKEIAAFAKQFVGNPYKSGGTSLTNGADCSGFVQSVFKHFGIKLPRGAGSQSKVGVKVPYNKLEPGDLVFYSNGSSKVSHVAIYIGNGKIIHSQTPKDGIGIDGVNVMHKVTARRVIK